MRGGEGRIYGSVGVSNMQVGYELREFFRTTSGTV